MIELKLPALRDRPGDIPVLAQAILARLAARATLVEPPRLSSVTLKYLCSYGFPGNVRELENILERALAFSNGEVVNVEDLGLRPAVSDLAGDERAEAGRLAEPVEAPVVSVDSLTPGSLTSGSPARVRVSDDGIPESLPDYLDQIEREAIHRALERTRFNRTPAAKLLGITFRALRYRMQRLGIS